MIFQQFYLGCLAHASYLVASDGEAAIVDPQRDVEQYLERARELGVRIRYVVETHVHADFVSGHRELAERAGAEVVFGARAGAAFPHRAVRDGDVLHVGRVALRILETPGHTPESICVLASDEAHPEEPPKLMTGDTLFIGDVGRPDLVGSKGQTSQHMAAMLYDSLHGKVLTLPDRVEIYPAHGAGSLCGKNLSTETWSTLGEQRRTNYALQPMPKERFVEIVTHGLPEVPAYFSIDVALNRGGKVPALGTLAPPAALAPEAVVEASTRGALVLDVRPSEEYGASHVPGSLNVGLDGQFASWAGTLIPFERPIVVVAGDEHGVEEAVMRLARVGFANVGGYLRGGVAAWTAAGLPTASTPQWTPADLHDALEADAALLLLDVRRPGEYAELAIAGAVPIPLAQLPDALERLDPARRTAVICGSGYRSSIATSLLEAAGFARLANVDGGLMAYAAAGYPTVEHVAS